VGIERSRRPIAASRVATEAGHLLDASTLCAIATVAPGGRAHINTAYFARTAKLDVVWLSDPRAKHSRNIRANDSVAIAVYDSTQTWGQPDRGIQLFGKARELEPSAASEFEALYNTRFPDYSRFDLPAYRFYVLRPFRLKLFEETRLGPGVLVTARVRRDGRTTWERTDISRADA
jgi:uncharacterized protein YhbP (UPF0306 family)